MYLSTTESRAHTSYIYDNNGNLTDNGTFLFSYDYKNRLVEVKKTSDSSLVAKYKYDILGRRIQKLTETSKTEYLYAGENAILETNTSLLNSAKITTVRIYGNGIDDLLAYETDDTTLSATATPEYTFCLDRILPYTADFEKYGWIAVTNRCNDLQNQYTITERKLFYIIKDHFYYV